MMRKSDDVLTPAELTDLIRSGFEPEFRSLAGIFKDASKLGARKAYLELVEDKCISRYSSHHYEMIDVVALLSREDDKQLMNITLDNTANAIQYAARLGYNRMYYKS